MNRIEKLAELLTMAQNTIGIAESCTGGLLSSAVTDMPGSSSFFEGGVVAYSNVAKIEVVGVPMECLRNHGAVSGRTALAMANGAREAFSADIGLAVTGITGPAGGTEEKPVGLVHIAVSESENEITQEYQFEGDRASIKQQAVEAAIELCIEFLEQEL